jgi:hypothetical protein
VLPKDAREATDTFVKRKQGDALLNWETEAFLAKKTGEWTVPYKVFSPNVLTEMPIAVVDKNVDKKGTRKAAEAFAKYLYTPTAQKIFVDNGFRPVTPAGKAYAKGKFPQQRSSEWAISAAGPAWTRSFSGRELSGIRSSPRHAEAFTGVNNPWRHRAESEPRFLKDRGFSLQSGQPARLRAEDGERASCWREPTRASMSSRVLYTASVARTVASTPKRRRIGWAQW